MSGAVCHFDEGGCVGGEVVVSETGERYDVRAWVQIGKFGWTT